MDLHLLPFIIFSPDVWNMWILILFSKPTMDDRLKGSSLAVLNEDSDTTPNSRITVD